MLEPQSVPFDCADDNAPLATGLVVKNTFFEFVVPADPPEHGCQRRSFSAPAEALPRHAGHKGLRVLGDLGSASFHRRASKVAWGACDASDDSSSTGSSTSTGIFRRRSTSCQRLSSTASTLGDCFDSPRLSAQEPEPEELSLLRETVLHACGFLRIRGNSWRSSRQLQRTELGSMGCLMFFVFGLPWAVRSKWLVPLRWTAAGVLHKCGYIAKVHAGKLYVSNQARSLTVTVDFAPSLRGSVPSRST